MHGGLANADELPDRLGSREIETLGEGVETLQLGVGDTFGLGGDEWMITGVMKAEGTTYGSEVWTGVNNTVVVASGKGNKYTTLVLRMADNTEAASRGMAYYLQFYYDQVKLKAYSEPDYYR